MEPLKDTIWSTLTIKGAPQHWKEHDEKTQSLSFISELTCASVSEELYAEYSSVCACVLWSRSHYIQQRYVHSVAEEEKS